MKNISIIICKDGKKGMNYPCHIIDTDTLEIIKSFKKTYYKKGTEYNKTIQNLVSSGVEIKIYESLEDAKQSFVNDTKLKQQIINGKKFISNKEIDSIIDNIINNI